jgi:hypothetical protein
MSGPARRRASWTGRLRRARLVNVVVEVPADAEPPFVAPRVWLPLVAAAD